MTEYAELHCQSFYSLLEGASTPEALLDRAAELGMKYLALTDHDGLYGAPRFFLAAKDRGIHPIIGAELTLEDGYHLLLLAENRKGYSNLSRLISHAHLPHEKGEPALALDYLQNHTEGLIALSGCRKGEIPSLLLSGKRKEAEERALWYASLFGPGNFYIELHHLLLPDSVWLIEQLVSLADELGLPYVATNNVHYATKADADLHDVKLAIKHIIPLEEAKNLLFPNHERCLKGGEEMASLFSRWPEAIANTIAIAQRCNMELDFRDQRLPAFPLPAGESPSSYLEKLCIEGIRRRYGENPEQRVWDQLRKELDVIRQMELETYFLIVWDIIRFAKERNIPAQGRGSAGDSVVAYALGITSVDPIKYNFLFERFLNPEGTSSPDIDIDFSSKEEHREEVIRYVYETYGQEHTGMVATYWTYQPRGAIRDVGKALGFPPGVLDTLAKGVDRWTHSFEEEIGALLARGKVSEALPWKQFSSLCSRILDHPRHLSIHVGGMVITASPLVEIVPLERARMPGRVVIEWDKEWAEEVGLIKIDLLSLRTLAAVSDARQMIWERHGIDLDPEQLTLDDPEVYELLQDADSIGIFQFESRAQRVTLPRLRPQRFEDLINETALIRPGPIHLASTYLRRRQGKEPVTYPHPWLEEILSDTLGVIIFQEDVIRVAMRIAGFSAAMADRLRRAMSSKRSHAEMAKLQGRFMEGALGLGVSEAVAQEVWGMIAGFAEFGFCKSHAAIFAQTGYYTAYLKLYYPSEFYCALLNNQPMGFYDPEVVANDARRHGVRILPPDINRSPAKCTVEGQDIRLGLEWVHGLGEAFAEKIAIAQEKGAFLSLQDFLSRTDLPQHAIENLIMVGTMDGWGIPRRELLWRYGEFQGNGKGGQSRLELLFPTDKLSFRSLTDLDRSTLDYQLLGMAAGERDHIIRFYRDWLREKGAVSTRDLREMVDGARVRIGGMVVVRQSPVTAKGLLFMTLEDEEDLIDLVIYPQVWRRFRKIVHSAGFLLAEGVLQKEGQVLSVLARSFELLPKLTAATKPSSHDFR